MSLKLFGDVAKAGSWVPYAKKRLLTIKQVMTSCGLPMLSKKVPLPDGGLIEIRASNIFGVEQDSIMIYVPVGAAIIVAHVGTTTGEFIKKFYDLFGNEIPSDWLIVDDGKYGLIWEGIPHDDPDDYSYTTIPPDGLGVAAVSNGIAAQKILGFKQAQIILNTALEDEIYRDVDMHVVLPGVYDYHYNFLHLEDSLFFRPFKIKAKPFVSRYVDDGIVTLSHTWKAAVGGVMQYNAYLSEGMGDILPIVKRLYHTRFDGQGNKIRSFVAIDGDGAGAGAVNYYSDLRMTQDLIRADSHDFGGSPMAEPMMKETYSFDAAKQSGEDWHRCSNPSNKDCYFNDGGSTSGLDTIADDLKRVFSITETGALDYVRMQKNTGMTSHKTGVYVADLPVAETPWEDVLVLFDDEANGCPMYIGKTNYQILHSHHGEAFDAAVYRKNRYISHNSELLPYKIWRNSIGDYVQVRKVTVLSETTWYIAVNGKVTDLPYTSSNAECQLTALGTAYSGPPIQTVTGGYISRWPWVDIASGENLTRVFTTEAGDMLLAGFDVFPASFSHLLQYNLHGGLYNLEAVYDDSVIPFPPTSDGTYEFAKERKWMLFGTGGNLIRDIQPPKQKVAGIVKDWQRVNGLCLLQTTQ